jgi:hypothetical protein
MSNVVLPRTKRTRRFVLQLQLPVGRIHHDSELVIDSKTISVRVYLSQDCFPKQTMTHYFNLCQLHPTLQASRLLELRVRILSYR